MDSKTYWKNREEAQRQKNIKEEAAYQKEIEKIYDYMLDQIQREINGFYAKYAKAEGITLSEAKKRVSKLDIEAYERKAAKYVKEKDFSAEANAEMRLYNATMKINRLEMLKANIGLELVDGFNDLQKFFDQILTDRTLAEFERQAGILGMTVRNNEKAAHAIVNASFHNAKFSDRIWMYQDMLKNELEQLLRTGLIQGKNPRELARHLTKRFGVRKSDAERLMRTELSRVRGEAQLRSLKENGYEQYTFLALGSACDICKDIDGEHFYVDEAEVGVNMYPMHPNCMCAISGYMDREEYEERIEALLKDEVNDTIKSKKSVLYEGIPKKWKTIAFVDNVLKNTNPGYNTSDAGYKTNCTNCIPAYELRERGYDVVAKASTKNHYLERNPDAAWIDSDIKATTGNGLEDILSAMNQLQDGTRFEVAVTWKNSEKGHVFVAEKKEGKVHFYDVQSGTEWSSKIFERVQEGKTLFWRIDNLELSDRGITACEAGEWNEI